jgi:hypothetical protein
VLFKKEKKLSEQIVEKTIKEKFWLEEDAMNALRDVKKKDLSNFPDLKLPEDENNSKSYDYKELNIKRVLKDKSIPINFYTANLQNLLRNYPEYDIHQIALEIIDEYHKRNLSDTTQTKKESPKLIANFIEGDLRLCYDEDIDKRHKKLLGNNSLLNVSEYFLDRVS